MYSNRPDTKTVLKAPGITKKAIMVLPNIGCIAGFGLAASTLLQETV